MNLAEQCDCLIAIGKLRYTVAYAMENSSAGTGVLLVLKNKTSESRRDASLKMSNPSKKFTASVT